MSPGVSSKVVIYKHGIGMQLVKAKIDDVEKIAKMNKHLIEDEQHPNKMNTFQLTNRMKSWLENEYICYLATDGKKMYGYCLYRDDGEYYYLRQLFVEKQYRRKGIATQILDWMYSNVWQEKKVRIDVLSHNENAIVFYEKYGFQVGCLRMEK